MAEDHTAVAHVIAKGIHDLVIEERQQLLARVDEVHLQPEVPEHGGVFAPDDSGTENGNRAGSVVEVQDGVAIEDARVFEVNIVGPVRPRARGDDSVLERHLLMTIVRAVINVQRVLVEEFAFADKHINSVAFVEARPHVGLLSDDLAGRFSQIREAQGFSLRVSEAGIRLKVGHPEDGMPQRLAGNRSPVRATSANQVEAFHHGDPFAKLYSLHSRPFAPGPSADDDNIVIKCVHF